MVQARAGQEGSVWLESHNFYICTLLLLIFWLQPSWPPLWTSATEMAGQGGVLVTAGQGTSPSPRGVYFPWQHSLEATSGFPLWCLHCALLLEAVNGSQETVLPWLPESVFTNWKIISQLQSQILQTFLDLAVLKSKFNISHVASVSLAIIMWVCYSVPAHLVRCRNSSWSIICHGSSCHKLKTFSSCFLAQTKSILDGVCMQSIYGQKRGLKIWIDRERKVANNS